jgi:hypothetical protein
MSVIDFPAVTPDTRYHITIEYEGADGYIWHVEGVGILTTLGGFICISEKAEGDGVYIPPVMISSERVIRIDSDALPTTTN